MPPSVTVIIAAYNAQDTLARAARSALSEPETAEVIIVDDASQDDTCGVARNLAREDARVRLIPLADNQGPANARNRALEAATADYVAVLDSDDVFLPGRLARLLTSVDTDMVADNIAFVAPENLDMLIDRDWIDIAPEFTPLGATAFVRGNLQARGVARSELGFLKPVMARAFLARHGLRYDPELRLGEDYDLYVRMLLAGARLKLTRYPGYAAVVRPGSLSAEHGTVELSHLRDRLAAHLQTNGLSPDLAHAMRAHLKEVERKRDHRAFLDLRRKRGAGAALRYLFEVLDRPLPVMLQIARDKLGLTVSAGEAAPARGARLLLPTEG
ncbi:glycosyltransferase family 2 protein [uncultured Roseobacter sp.]|uniref:glycosyltransferase family 2 protein n=1 Tax=uncultured Roseobacter sp. TaxID=114847 RepID=UPI0026095B26|nr:glycosyltransferase family 2 protein [uncultured Roseobacter sp.]